MKFATEWPLVKGRWPASKTASSALRDRAGLVRDMVRGEMRRSF